MKQKATRKNRKPSTRPRVGDRGKDFMTPREVAHASGIGLLSVYAFLREGMLSSVRVGKSHYIPRREYERWQSQFERTGNAGGTKSAA
jgi:excisionase family DNA binding protein